MPHEDPEQATYPAKGAVHPLVQNAEIILGKNRNGPVGVVELAFHAGYATFEEKDFRFDEND
jgi:replicative DNA helicase